MSIYLLKLLQLCDPMLPIGGYAHSSGLETYVQQGTVCDAATANTFITQMLRNNIRYNDAAFVSLSYDLVVTGDVTDLVQLNETCTALKLASEMRTASHKLGQRLMKVFAPLCKNDLVKRFAAHLKQQQDHANYCILFGLFGYIMQIPKQELLLGFYYNVCAGLVTNCVKLIPLGQQDGQEILYTLQDMIQQLAYDTMEPEEELLGLCCNGFDIASMQHERLYSRLYMS